MEDWSLVNFGCPFNCVSEVFEGNTSDLSTFESQVSKAARRFDCERVTFVGDRGMIKSGQMDDLSEFGFHYITAITKAQIRSLIKKGVFQLGLFDEKLCDIDQDGVRYILRRNPLRAEEMARNRAEKLETLKRLADRQNAYLADHPRADDTRSWRLVVEKLGRLGLNDLCRSRLWIGELFWKWMSLACGNSRSWTVAMP